MTDQADNCFVVPFITTEMSSDTQCFIALNLDKRVRRDGNSEAVAETCSHYPLQDAIRVAY